MMFLEQDRQLFSAGAAIITLYRVQQHPIAREIDEIENPSMIARGERSGQDEGFRTTIRQILRRVAGDPISSSLSVCTLL